MDEDELIYDLIIDKNFQQYVISEGVINPTYSDDWLCEYPGNSEIFAQAINIVLFITTHKKKTINYVLSEESYKKILRQIDSKKQNNKILKKKHNNWIYQTAAILIFLMGLTFLFSEQLENAIIKSKSEKLVEIKTVKGERCHVFLPDSTEVWLNSGSTLSYPEHFGNSYRNVSLKGEAYFQVRHCPSKPFIVSSGKRYQVKVLGTTFDVKYDTKSTNFKTTLFTGSVLIFEFDKNGNAINELKLKPGEQANLKTGETGIHLEKEKILSCELEFIAAWKNGILMFKDESLSVIALQLENWFGIEVRIEEIDLMSERFTGAFFNNESVSEVLDVFRKTVPIDYTIDENRLTISKKKLQSND